MQYSASSQPISFRFVEGRKVPPEERKYYWVDAGPEREEESGKHTSNSDSQHQDGEEGADKQVDPALESAPVKASKQALLDNYEPYPIALQGPRAFLHHLAQTTKAEVQERFEPA